MKILFLSAIFLAMMANPVFSLDFYHGTISAEFQEGRGQFARSSQENAQVSYARDGDRFVLVVSIGEYDPDLDDYGLDFYFEFHGEIERDGNLVKLYELPLYYGNDRNDGGDGKCHSASYDCTLRFKWRGASSAAGGRIVTKFANDTVQLTFGITGYWFPIGPQKLDLTGKLQRSASASKNCEWPLPGASLREWTTHCSSY